MSATNLPFGQIINFDYAFFITPQEREAVEVIPLHHHMMSYSPYKKVSWKWHETTYFLDIIHISSRTNSQDEFAIDYLFLFRYRKSTPPSWLHTIWRGPLHIISLRDSQYTLWDLISKKGYIFHISDMKPFIFDPTHTDPQDLARHDYLRFFVEIIWVIKETWTSKQQFRFTSSG